ncbi:MAG TPA: arsenate reductase (glutaredoxin) [Candidatus Poseidoniaceae archaeon]|nr:MAG TPA: arsenate reductase (glutaredoxin) [Candidatus Poseidoniales archaeon]HII45733.1 arsenate reductase (glutaredoxin) [Candidatus Poseidoniaceae archaeon]
MRLYHNPRCSKSRQALALLKERKLEFEDYRYLDKGIAEEDMDLLISLSGIIRMQEMTQSARFDLGKPADIRQLLVDNPKALERPVLIKDGRAVIGRPPESILDLLE